MCADQRQMMQAAMLRLALALHWLITLILLLILHGQSAVCPTLGASRACAIKRTICLLPSSSCQTYMHGPLRLVGRI